MTGLLIRISGLMTLQIPRLCTATAFICEERENNARIRAEKEQIENEQWQQKFKVILLRPFMITARTVNHFPRLAHSSYLEEEKN